MTPMSIRDYAEAVRPRYMASMTRVEKGRILCEFCRVTGYHRDSAIRILGHPPASPGRRRGRRRTYGPEVGVALGQLWEAADRICAKSLHPFMSEFLESLERHGEIKLSAEVRCQVLAMSSATMDRLLGPYRRGLVRQPYCQGRTASAIQALVPVRTFSEWEDVEVGSLQMDLVLHCGESTEGFYLTTLVGVDVATGWCDPRALWGKGKDRVGSGAHHIAKALPFPLREMHTDNGGEFINDALYPWAKRNGIGFTRGRPYKKNDQAIVEQKNWTLVRERIGYDRYSSKAAYQALEALYRVLRPYVNFFQPIRKLISKGRVGAKVVKRYDVARTPYQRLLESGVLDEEKRAELEELYRSLNPAKLKREVDAALDILWKLAERPRGSQTMLLPIKATAACG